MIPKRVSQSGSVFLFPIGLFRLGVPHTRRESPCRTSAGGSSRQSREPCCAKWEYFKEYGIPCRIGGFRRKRCCWKGLLVVVGGNFAGGRWKFCDNPRIFFVWASLARVCGLDLAPLWLGSKKSVACVLVYSYLISLR